MSITLCGIIEEFVKSFSLDFPVKRLSILRQCLFQKVDIRFCDRCICADIIAEDRRGTFVTRPIREGFLQLNTTAATRFLL